MDTNCNATIPDGEECDFSGQSDQMNSDEAFARRLYNLERQSNPSLSSSNASTLAIDDFNKLFLQQPSTENDEENNKKRNVSVKGGKGKKKNKESGSVSEL